MWSWIKILPLLKDNWKLITSSIVLLGLVFALWLSRGKVVRLTNDVREKESRIETLEVSIAFQNAKIAQWRDMYLAQRKRADIARQSAKEALNEAERRSREILLMKSESKNTEEAWINLGKDLSDMDWRKP